MAACAGVGMNACGYESSCTYHGTDVKCTVGPGTTCVSCSPCDADFPPADGDDDSDGDVTPKMGCKAGLARVSLADGGFGSVMVVS